jgi:hypothetical protein
MPASKPTLLLTAALMTACMLNACYQAKSPDEVAKDTAAATSAAAEKTEKALETADNKVASAEQVVQDEKTAAAHTEAVATEKVMDAKAEGRHKIALAKCESLSGEDQKACRQQADAAFNTAQDVAKQTKAEADPKP